MIEPIIYEVVGLTLEFMPNGKLTQGSLSVMAGDETFIADLNLTSLPARSKFARAAHELYPETLDEARVKRALNDFAVQLREQQLAAEAKADESPAEGAISAINLKVPEEGTERYEVAMRILRSDDVLMAAARAMRALGHEGEWRNKMLAFTCAVSAKAQLPVQPSTHAQSSAGKNHLWDTALALLPPELVYKRTGFSAKALFRTEMSLRHGILYIQELAGSEGADFSIRALQSDNELIYEATEKQPDGSWTNVEYRVEGPTVVVQTTTKSHLHPENETRVVPIYLDESPEQTDRITLAERRRATGKRQGIPPEKRESIRAAWHDAVWLLEPLEVVIPFAERIKVPSAPVRLRRDVPRLLNIIQLVAWVHQHTRERDAHGRIIATEGDFERAIEIVGESFSRAWKELSPSEEIVYNTCTKLPEKLRRGGFKRTHVEKVLEKVGETLPTRTVQACLSNLVEAGYLESDGKRGAAGATYWITGTKKAGGSITLSDPPAYSRIGGKAGEPSVDKRNSKRSNASARSCASRVGDEADQTAADESVMRKDAQNDSCTSKVLQTGEKEANAQTRNYTDGAGEPTLIDEEPDDGFEFLPKSSATVGTVVQMIEAADVVALDLETTGLDPRRSEIRLVQVSNGEKTYLIDLFTVGEARAIFEALARDDLTVIAHGAAFEYGFVHAKYGIALDNLRDTLLLARLVACGDVRLECSLEAVAERELGISLDKTLQSADWSGELTLEHLRYAAEDARVLLSLYRSLSKKVSETSQDRVSEIEHDALPAVSRMRLEGMPVDKAAWDAHAKEVVTELRALKAEMLSAEWMPERDPIPQTWTLQGPECLEMLYAAGLEGVIGTSAKDLADHADNPLVEALLAYRKAKGEERDRLRAHVLELAPDRPPAVAPPWNFGSPQQVKEMAYKILGFNLKSTNEATLLEFASWHPFFKYLLKYRELSKRMGTYGPGWFKGAYDEETGRVYPSWQQIGTSTGRFSCSSPNAQNIPNDGPYRSFFRAPSGRMFVDVDYSQIEVRIYGRLVGETALLGLFERGDADVYRATAANLLGITEEEVTKEERQKAKAIMLGLLYGLSAQGLPAYAFKNYGVTIEPNEAEALIERFFEFYPAIASDHASVLFELESTGYIDRKTLTGRCRDNITVRNEAINMPIQGTAADGLKIAIGRVYEELKKFDGTAFIVAALHDELLVECNEADAPEIEDIVAEAMLEAMNELLNASEPRVELEVSGGRARVWTKD